MEEDSLRFWIVPVVFLIIGFGIFAIVAEYNFNVKMPNAAAELEEMRSMSCDEIKAIDSVGRYWSKENQAFGNEKAESCQVAEAAIKEKEKKRMDKLLADPNSFESLSRDLKKFQELYESNQELYETQSSEVEILKQNVADFENQINEIKAKLEQNYGVQ